MSQIRPLKILISGTGIAGPCLAYWLTRTRLNAQITIVERSPAPRVTGQAIDVRGPAVDIVRMMGLADELRARGTTEEGTVLLTRRHKIRKSNSSEATRPAWKHGNAEVRKVAAFGFGEMFTAEYEILRADLCDLFLESLQDAKNVRYVYGDYVTAIEQDLETPVKIKFANGGTDTYDVVVGADGSTSRTRSMILTKDELADSYKLLGQYTAFFSIPRLDADPKIWQWYSEEGGLAAMIRPHRAQDTMGAYLTITLPKRGQTDLELESAIENGVPVQKQAIRHQFRNSSWQTQRLLDGMDIATDFYMSRAAQVVLPKWTNGQAVLIGDAAHATFGVGTSMTIEGAYMLAGELGKLADAGGGIDGSAIREAIARYEAVARPRFATMEGVPSGFPQLANPQTRTGLWIRDAVIWLVAKSRIWKLMEGGSDAVKWILPTYAWREV